jgi:hypothetical protein
MFSDVSPSLGVLGGARPVKTDLLAKEFAIWEKKCNSFEENVLEYIEFEKLIELLMENAFVTMYLHERREKKKEDAEKKSEEADQGTKSSLRRGKVLINVSIRANWNALLCIELNI